jgi:hypothetical protein
MAMIKEYRQKRRCGEVREKGKEGGEDQRRGKGDIEVGGLEGKVN